VPLFCLVCTSCGEATNRLADTAPAALQKPCTKCQGVMKRQPKGVSSQVMEKLDNGAMPRAVERLADAERLYNERAANSDPLAGGAQRVAKE